MKIGIVFPYNLFRGGGVKECVLALQQGIIARGHQALIITPQPRDYRGSEPEGVVMLGGSIPFRAIRTEGNVSASADLANIDAMLKRENFDILHFHEPWNPMLSYQILSRSNAINIGTFHAAMSERRSSRSVERVITPYTKSILTYLDVMTAVSPAASIYVKSLTKRHVQIVANGIDLDKYSYNPKVTIGNTTKTILYVGRLEKRKGVKYLLSAYAHLKQTSPHTRLIITGDGPERQNLETQVSEMSIRDVSFLGMVDEETKLDLFARSDLFCSPAMHGESFGIVLLEAMASGRVVVAGNNPGYESVMAGRGRLSLVNPKDTSEFARRLSLLLDDESLRTAWLDWAQDEVKKYSYDNIVDQYMAIYSAAHKKHMSHEKR